MTETMNETAQRHLGDLAPLARQIVDLKRVRDRRSPRSVLEQAFGAAWTALVQGHELRAVAEATCARVLAAVRLGCADRYVLLNLGVDAEAASDALSAAMMLALADGGMDGTDLAGRFHDSWNDTDLHDALDDAQHGDGDSPKFVGRLIDQPRAGVTYPGAPRIVLEPSESHGDHCGAVAVLGVLASPAFEADPAQVFLAALAHHFHNYTLPDAGYAGGLLLEQKLGAARVRGMAELSRERALRKLSIELRAATEAALDFTSEAYFDTPNARAFHAADALDRVLEIEWHERTARFRREDALGRDAEAGLQNVGHAGFPRHFQERVLKAAGLMSS